MKVDPDLITLAAVCGIILVGLGALIVMYHGLERNRQLTTQLARAEAKAARYHALVGASVFEPRHPWHGPTETSPTEPLPRINERHLIPVSNGGRISPAQYRQGLSDGT